jgi:GNAT superfamily N-acetyltransferase
MAGDRDVETLVRFNLAMALDTEHKQLDRVTLEMGVRAAIGDGRKGFYLVAEAGGDVVGGLLVTCEWSDWRNGWYWWLQSVYVEPAFREKGVFRALYGEVKRLAADASSRVVGFRLYVEQDNRSAMDAYLRVGFSETSYRVYENRP